MKTPADAVKHKASTARTPKIPSALEGWPFVVALAGLPLELPDAADVWLSPPAEEVLEFVDAEAVLPPITLVPALFVPAAAAEVCVGESALPVEAV